MRVTQSRYNGELDQFQLAIRMLELQARTSTIGRFTGLSSDRIRKAYLSYLTEYGKNRLPRRKRGRPPTRVAYFFKSRGRHCESVVLVSLFLHAGLLKHEASARWTVPGGLSRLTQGRRLCDAYDMYRHLMPGGELSLELAASLYRALSETQEVAVAECASCGALYVRDAYALDYGLSPFCEEH